MLRSPLEFNNASIDAINFIPTSDEPKAVLVVTADCTPAIAEVLDRAWVYQKESSIPQEGLSKVPLDGVELSDIQMQIPRADDPEQWQEYRPDVITKFSVTRCEDVKLSITFRVHLTGYFHELVDFFKAANKETFGVKVSPLQGELFNQENTVQAEASTGTGDTVTPVSALASKATVQGIDYKKGRRRRGEASKNVCDECGEVADREIDGVRYCFQHIPAIAADPFDSAPETSEDILQQEESCA